MENEVEVLKQQLRASNRIREQLDKRIQQEAAKSGRAIATLKFYADYKNWNQVNSAKGSKTKAIVEDNGKAARRALSILRVIW